MTNEEKELLLKDISARLPYGVKCTFNGKYIYKVYGIDEVVNDDGDWEYAICTKRTSPLYISDCKPYLFPLSSMTEEQRKEFNTTLKYLPAEEIDIWTCDTYDWCDKNHFDYRGLIPMGLANNATGLNIY